MCNTIASIFRLAIVGACVVALGCQFAATFNCDFLNFGGFDVASLGLWYYGIAGECLTTEFEAIDDGLIAGARSSLIISMLCGAAATVMITFEWLCCEVCCAGCLEGIALAAAWILGAGTFMIYGLDICSGQEEFDETIPGFPDVTVGVCEWGSGSSWATVAVVLYMGAGFLLCCAPQPDPICRK